MKLRHFDAFAVLIVIILFVSAMAHGQVGIGSGQQAPTQPTYTVPDHPQHADYGSMRTETSLLGSTMTVAHGERPLSDFPDDGPAPKPLGDVAREYRQEHAKAEKATRIWNQ
jgi:hypothetical protein